MTDADDKAEAALLEEMTNFLEAGGRITYDDWASLDIRTKAALVMAARRIEAGRLAGFAHALGHSDAAAGIISPHDGGAALVALRLTSAVNAAAVRRSRR